ncbi:hypothetical protein Y032_0383g385 [Ancylostoma ceylanicum]|uniref:Peptidase M13 C-terminal domain-containing protein n=1 Tax=Ancylostoma ceylanicum TaxID=53326 RepID=A0A016RU26_9BILA|nr:hypothetical protein Y032_0383g385 [Ancylostoma ceylanicum]
MWAYDQRQPTACWVESSLHTGSTLKLAWRNRQSIYGSEPRFDAMQDFSNEQAFFIGYATVRKLSASPYRLHTDRTKHWCGRLSLDLTMALLIADVHSLYNIRVNNVLANIPEFAEAFHCAPGTRMNPGKRCSMY